MDKEDLNLSDIETTTDLQDKKRWQKLKNLKEHPLDTLSKSWNIFDIWSKYTFSFTTDLIEHASKY